MCYIRDAEISDVGRILEIYDYYVRNTAITFECVTPSENEFISRMNSIKKKYPFFVIEDCGRVMGYAYANTLIDRAAYDWSCELSIYIDKSARNNGYGRMLYDKLENELKNKGIKNLYACIAYPNTPDDKYLTTDSADFHRHMGFSKVGRFNKCGYKFGRWYDIVWMEKLLELHT